MQSPEEFNYQDRYGKTGGKRWLPYAIALAVVGIAWSLWAGIYHANPEIRSQLISFSATGENEMSLRYYIERTDPKQVVICTLVVMDQDKSVVGQIDDVISAGTSRSEQTTAIAARITPVSASIARCRTQ